MYCPKSFAKDDLAALHDLIEIESFATLISLEGSRPIANHLPLLLDRTQGLQGTLIGHLARANSQGTSADGQTVLAIFQGPHAYISPSWYAEKNVVPTWNYVAVHATGTLRLITDAEQKLHIVRQYIDFYEAARNPPWSMDEADAGFIHGLLEAIDGFAIEIEDIQGKWKLNQNHSAQRRDRVIEALRKAGGEDRLKIADLIAATLE